MSTVNDSLTYLKNLLYLNKRYLARFDICIVVRLFGKFLNTMT